MGVKKVLIVFSGIYIPLLIASVVAAGYFSHANVLLVSACILWACAKGCCTRFIQKNNRDFTKEEKITVFWGFFLIAVIIDLLFLAFVFWKFAPEVGGISDTFVIGITMVLARAIPAYVAVGVHKKNSDGKTIFGRLAEWM